MTTPDDPRPTLCRFCAENLTVFYIPTTNPFVSSLRFKLPICKPCLDTHISEDLAGKPR